MYTLLIMTVLIPAAVTQTELARLTVDDASAYAAYGDTVAMSGDVALVGAPDDAVAGNYAGSVYVFRKTGSSWAEEAKLTASDGAALHAFGNSLAIDGDLAVIGAPAPLLDTEAGEAYVFRYNGSTWVEEAKLGQIAVGSRDWFGSSVAIEGNRIVVGAMWTRLPGLNWGGPNHAGAAWVFDHDGTSWVMTQMLTASDKYDNDHFGASVALEGDRILVGATGEGDEPLQMYYIGAVYSFEFDGQEWIETQKIRASNYADQSFFGDDLAMNQGVAVVGSPGKKSQGVWGAGAAYIFRHNGSTWEEEEKLSSPWPDIYGKFGHAVAVEGDLVLIGDNNRDTAGNVNGAVFAYRHDGEAWEPEPAFSGSKSSTGIFGSDIALEGNTALVGGWEENTYPESDGAAYLFDLSPQFHLMAAPLPLVSGDDAKIMIRNGVPGNPTIALFRVEGIGGWLTLGIQNFDNTGEVVWEFPLPPAAAGFTVTLVALRLGGISNFIKTEIK
jgi:hypothetical protein